MTKCKCKRVAFLSLTVWFSFMSEKMALPWLRSINGLNALITNHTALVFLNFFFGVAWNKESHGDG